MPLINIPFPANAQILFQELIKIVTFDFLEIKDALGIEQEFDFTETFAYNDNFDELGYGTQNTVDLLGSINFIIAILFTRILLFVIYRPMCCNRTKVCRKIKSKTPQDGDSLIYETVRFCIETLFELLIAVLVTLNKSEKKLPNLLELDEWTSADAFSVVYTYAIVTFLVLFGFYSLWAIFYKANPIRKVKRTKTIKRLTPAIIEVLKVG